jgi:hypothetical protein
VELNDNVVVVTINNLLRHLNHPVEFKSYWVVLGLHGSHGLAYDVSVLALETLRVVQLPPASDLTYFLPEDLGAVPPFVIRSEPHIVRAIYHLELGESQLGQHKTKHDESNCRHFNLINASLRHSRYN